MKYATVLLCLFLIACTALKRHPVRYGMIAGTAVGLTVGLLDRHTCPNSINGMPYDGTYPCPNAATYRKGWPQNTKR